MHVTLSSIAVSRWSVRDLFLRNHVFVLLRAFIDIILHRRGPEDLPASRFLLAVILVIYLSIGFLVIWVSEHWLRALSILAVDATLYLIFVRLLLLVNGFPNRFLQSATALLGISTVFNAVALPFLFWLEVATDNGVLPLLPYAALIALLIWSLDVSAFVLSRAISKPYVAGVAIVIGYFLFSLLVRGVIFPPQG